MPASPTRSTCAWRRQPRRSPRSTTTASTWPSSTPTSPATTRTTRSACGSCGPGGLILIDNVLWSGEVAEPGDGSENARIMRALNEKMAADERVDHVLLPIGDGLTLAPARSLTAVL